MAIVVGFFTLAAAATLTEDPLTGLPLLPATSGPLGNEPTSNSKVQAEYYSVSNFNMSSTLNWYASRLAGFHKTLGFASRRSQDAFYNADGTTVVSVGSEARTGEDAETYAVSYTRFQPRLPATTIIGINQHNIVCN